MKPQEWYNNTLSKTNSKLENVNKTILYISIARVVLFIGCIATIYLLWDKSNTIIIASALCTFVPFLSMIKLHNKFYHRRKWLEVKADILQKELKGLDNDYSEFDDGKEFTDPEHLYSFDLDVFGKKSLFQALNRTCTHIGKSILADWLKNHLRNKNEIEKRQQAIKDLCAKNDFRLDFEITGMLHRSKNDDTDSIKTWVNTNSKMYKSTKIKAILLIVPSINTFLLICGLSGLISFSWFGLSFSTFVIASFSIIKKATIVQDEYNSKLKTLRTYAKLISLMQNEQWNSDEIKEIINSLQINGKSPSEILNKLTKELDRLDLRNNQLLYVILEGSMFFQLRQLVRIEQWKDKYGQYLVGWIEVVGKIDALCSLATFAYNHPEYSYPKISAKPFCFEAKEMGHPLMPKSQCVKNDAIIPSRALKK